MSFHERKINNEWIEKHSAWFCLLITQFIDFGIIRFKFKSSHLYQFFICCIINTGLQFQSVWEIRPMQFSCLPELLKHQPTDARALKKRNTHAEFPFGILQQDFCNLFMRTFNERHSFLQLWMPKGESRQEKMMMCEVTLLWACHDLYTFGSLWDEATWWKLLHSGIIVL